MVAGCFPVQFQIFELVVLVLVSSDDFNLDT